MIWHGYPVVRWTLFCLLIAALFALSLGVEGRSLLSRRKVFLLGVGAALVLALALPFLLPYARNRDRGFYRRYEDVALYSASLRDYASPSRFNRPPYAAFVPSQSPPEKALLPGFVAMGLALIGVAAGRSRERLFWLFGIILTATAAVLSLGQASDT